MYVKIFILMDSLLVLSLNLFELYRIKFEYNYLLIFLIDLRFVEFW